MSQDIRLLIVGDLHAQVSNLEDTEAILEEIEKIASNPENKVDHVIFMGDLYHTHSVLRQEVIALIKKRVPYVHQTNGTCRRPIILVGNHDMVGPTNATTNAISLTLEHGVRVIDSPTQILQGILAVPFTSDPEKFVAYCNEDDFKETKLLLCHQTFDGSQYENGFYAPDGVKQERIRQPVVISGHIHKEQHVGKVYYVGTPRALNSSEYNEKKGVKIITYSPYLGKILDVESFDFNDKVKTYHRYDISEGQEFPVVPLTTSPKDDILFHIHGTKEFCNQMTARIEALNLVGTIKIVPDVKRDVKKQLSIEEAGVSTEDVLKKYVFEVSDIESTSKEKVWQKIQKLMT